MRRAPPFIAITLLLVSACSGRERTGSPDGGSAPADAGWRDAFSITDAGGTDAGGRDGGADDAGGRDGGADDGGGRDGGALDAAIPDGGADAARTDAGEACGDVGKPCSSIADCGGGLECRGSGVCLRSTAPICGGFAGATCPASEPHCLYCSGCDFGPCLKSDELACLCARPDARSRFPDCP